MMGFSSIFYSEYLRANQTTPLPQLIPSYKKFLNQKTNNIMLNVSFKCLCFCLCFCKLPIYMLTYFPLLFTNADDVVCIENTVMYCTYIIHKK